MEGSRAAEVGQQNFCCSRPELVEGRGPCTAPCLASSLPLRRAGGVAMLLRWAVWLEKGQAQPARGFIRRQEVGVHHGLEPAAGPGMVPGSPLHGC